MGKVFLQLSREAETLLRENYKRKGDLGKTASKAIIAYCKEAKA